MAASLTTADRLRGLALALGLLLAGCTSTPDNQQVSLPVPQAAAQADDAAGGGARAPAHPRLLWRHLRERQAASDDRQDRGSAGGGIRAAGPEIQGDHPQFARDQRLRAAERPPLRHARADRARQRQGRARLGAGARNGPRDRAPCRDPRGPGAPGGADQPRGQRRAQRSADGRAGARQIEARRWRPSRARRNSRPTASASASRRAPASIRYGASRFLTDMQRNADLKPAGGGRSARARLPLHPSGDARAGQERARQCPPVQRPRHRRTRPRRISRQPRRHGLWRGPERGLRARPPLPASQARLHLPGAARICPRQHRAGGARPQEAATRRCGSTSSACRPSSRCPIT